MDNFRDEIKLSIEKIKGLDSRYEKFINNFSEEIGDKKRAILNEDEELHNDKESIINQTKAITIESGDLLSSLSIKRSRPGVLHLTQ